MSSSRRRGGGSTAVPAGYHLVQAKGTVFHARVELVEHVCRRDPRSGRPSCGPEVRNRLVDLATGKARPATDVQEVWWDPKSGLVRVVGSTAGQVAYDRVGQQCQLGIRPRFCNEPPPFGLAKFGFSLPVDTNRARIAGHGVVRGHDVIWVELTTPAGAPSVERVALDVRNHEPVARKENFLGMTEFFSRLPNLPGRSVKFVVPDGGAPQNSYPPGSGFSRAVPRPVDQTQKALGRTPYWLGPSYQGHRLRSAAVGTEGEKAANGAKLEVAPFVSFDYGIVRLQEFAHHPSGQPLPPQGKLLLTGDRAALLHNGILVVADLTSAADHTPSDSLAAALALAKALRPVG